MKNLLLIAITILTVGCGGKNEYMNTPTDFLTYFFKV